LSGRDPISDYEIINRELANYDADLADRPQIIVATKTDAIDDPERLEKLRKRAKKDRKPFFAISSVTNDGVKELVNAVSDRLRLLTRDEAESRARTAVS
jgi:GTP-binding protein